MDETDRKILQILQRNARTTITQIGQEVGLTSPSVSERIRRLESDNVLLGYHAQVDPLKLGKNICAYICVNVQPEKQRRFVDVCGKNPCILSHTRVIGAYNAILYVVAHDSSELERIIDELKQYGTTLTSIILSTYHQDKPI